MINEKQPKQQTSQLNGHRKTLQHFLCVKFVLYFNRNRLYKIKSNYLMKGINLQFDNLVSLLQRNINDKQFIGNRDSFDMVYQKVTQQTLRTVSFIFEGVIEDFSIKQSYDKLLRELKGFLALKPALHQDDEDQFYNQEFDQLKQFMNSRKPIQHEINNSQRGDMYKFLSQAQDKQKDMAQFMGNMNKLNIRGSRKFILSTKKIKQPLNDTPVDTQQICTQTDVTMQVFQKLEGKFPGLFRTHSFRDSESNKNGNQQHSSVEQQLDIDGKINQILRQRFLQMQRSNEDEERAGKQKKMAEKQQKKKQQDKTKKKAAQNKRTSQISLKKGSNPGSILKSKSNFALSRKQGGANIQSERPNANKNVIIDISTKTKTNQNSPRKALTIVNQASCQIGQRKIDYIRQKIDKFMPSFQNICKLLPGVSQQDMKKVYESLKTSIAENFKIQTVEKQVNTTESYLQNMTGKIDNFRESQLSKKDINSIKNTNNKTLLIGTQNSEQQNVRKGNQLQPDKSMKKSGLQSQKNKKNGNYRTFSQQNLNHDAQNALGHQNLTSNRQSPKNQNNKNNMLPNINKARQNDDNEILMNNSIKNLSKESRNSQTDTNNLSDSKVIRSLQRTKIQNKQNYSLDMYKTKNDLLSRNSRASDHVNLPSLNRSIQQKGTVSLHQHMSEDKKSSFIKKSGKNNVYQQSIDFGQNGDKKNNNNEGKLKKTKNDKNKDVFKQQERIMKQLQRIADQNSIKSNLKNIFMYVQFVETVHLRRCGQKCIHLERFYEFMNRKNIPNRTQLMLHKADMNISVNL